ncbi:protein PET100 homolog, mitochondrial isoform X1 [Nematostella vectensis]|uniref:protein PET100 homolog, mitochondrial isoform X1 n=1 Tax=Nematostella vectensis TaxID=45351 RepID=UPI00138FD696|nr:protein PET100 homolog, mitochondrial isoform X1 [Nematostella vectensis]
MATGSKIELFRIAVYVFFPVALFYYFNLPEIYEDYVNNKKGQIYPPDETTHVSFDSHISSYILRKPIPSPSVTLLFFSNKNVQPEISPN